MRPRQLAKRVVYGAAWRSGALSAIRWLHRRRVPILCYHSIVERTASAWDQSSGGLHLPLAQFARQMEFLARHYRVVPLDGVARELACGRPPAERSVALTFDDGYANNLALAGPILEEFDFPATIFLATDYVGRTLFWWDDLWLRVGGDGTRAIGLEQGSIALRAATVAERERLLERWGRDPGRVEAVRPLTWSECRSAPAQIRFGGHGASHRLLGEISLAEARVELAECHRALRTELGARAVPLFCYPGGQWTDDVRASLPDAGFQAAVTAGVGWSDQRLAGAGDELSLLPRIGVTSRMNMAAFAARCAGL